MKFNFPKLTISRRILILFQVMTIPTIIIFIIFSFIMNRFIDMESKIFIDNISSIRAAYNLETALLSLKGYKSNYILNTQKKWLRDFEKNVVKFNYWYNEAFISAKTEYEKNILSNISLDFSKYLDMHREIIRLTDQKQKTKAVALLLNETDKNYRGIINGCKELITVNEKLIGEAESRAKSLSRLGEVLGYIIILFISMLGILLTVIITRSIMEPIHEMIDSDKQLIIQKSDNKEIRQLKSRFNNMISTIKEDQKKLLTAEKRASIGQVAAGLSHELNNPIGIICGITELMLKKNAVSINDRELLLQVNSEAERCKRLVGSMLDFARSPEPVFAVADLKELLRKNVTMLEKQLKNPDISFSLKLPRSSVKINMDGMQISQVIINILFNACDAVGERGLIHITLLKEEKQAIISIRDSGKGISENDLDNIFLPFFSTKPKGTGLGLAVSKDIIEKHGGSLAVASSLGSGTEFIISLPEKFNG